MTMARTAERTRGARTGGTPGRQARTGVPSSELASGRPGGSPISLAAAEIARHAVRLLVTGEDAARVEPFAALPQLLRAGDVVVLNDAATLPGSLRGSTLDGTTFELRLSGPVAGRSLAGVLLGAGDHHTRTELRPPPPVLAVGARVQLAGRGTAFAATVTARRDRRVELAAETPDAAALWQALYAAGRPVQYAHREALLPLHAVQTAYAARPWAAEMPSAGRALTWDILLALRRVGVRLARLTHAAGLSSTGDAALDAALPWPERYDIPVETAAAIAAARARGGRVVAIGTTVVRALEAARGAPGEGIATLRLDARTPPRIVDGLVSGLHVPGESHFDLLCAFAPPARLRAALTVAATAGLSAHELGDACLVWAQTT